MKTIKFIVAVVLAYINIWNGYSIEKSDTIKFIKKNVSHFDSVKFHRYESDRGNDSTEYELIVLDPGYETFLAMQPSKEFYSESYYKHWNRLYVAEWNIRYTTQARSGLYATYIDYDPEMKYGLELEYRLYYYFRFFEKENRVTLVPRGQ